MFLVGNIYRSPTSTAANNIEVMNQIKKSCEVAGDKRILLMGDYNLKEINWVEHYAAGSETSLPHIFYENIRDCFLHQHVD